ncbi:MAG: ribonuclease P protein component [Patescibacteria group bacterium]
MLRKQNRLKKKTDFDSVYKKGYTIAGKLVFLKVLKNKTQNSRFGFIVSKKVSKKAVIRNKIKRRLRSIVKNIDIKNGIDVIITTNPEIVEKTYQEIKLEMEDLFKKLC